MKRPFLLIMVLLLIVIPFIAGCSSNQAAQPSTNKDSVPQKGTTNEINSKTNNVKEFTLEELAQYNGLNGKPAYVAVKGVVYDVTNAKLWRAGAHSPIGEKNVAGQDLTAKLAGAPPSHQNQEFWDKLPKVGILKSTPKQ